MTEDELQRHLETIYPLVGRIIVDWALIEREVNDAAAVFSTIDLSGDKKPLRDRVELLRTAFCSLADDLEQRVFIDRLAENILDMADVRNIVANGIWSVQKGSPFTLTFSDAPLGREGEKPAELTVSASDLENLLDRMAKLRSELAVFPFR
jgi:hypothetical protein